MVDPPPVLGVYGADEVVTPVVEQGGEHPVGSVGDLHRIAVLLRDVSAGVEHAEAEAAPDDTDPTLVNSLHQPS